jgi:phosphohistidine phosphatase SixA
LTVPTCHTNSPPSLESDKDMPKRMIALALTLVIPMVFAMAYGFSKIVELRGSTNPLEEYKVVPNSNAEDLYWASEIVKSERELLLWFRHGEREKWTGTVTVFDYFDVNKRGQPFPRAWRPAVCLTPKGVAESQIVGATFRELKIIASHVITSPSCRAQETAIEAFGGYDEEWIEILHATAITAQQQEVYSDRLRSKLLKTFDDFANQNGHIIVTGHGNTLPFYSEALFDSSEVKNWTVSELGFVVIEKTEQGLVARHSFVEFYQFANALLTYSD